MTKVIEISDQDFEEEVLNADLPTEVDFWAPWCGPCMMVSPIYDKLAEEFDGGFKFCKMNVDENKQVAMRYGIQSIPMQMFFADGEKVDEIVGAVPESTIRGRVNRILETFPTDDKGKLRGILTRWIEENRKSRQKFDQWLKRADVPEGNPDYEAALRAVREMDRGTEVLLEALSALREKDR